jgi:hypothetical protein
MNTQIIKASKTFHPTRQSSVFLPQSNTFELILPVTKPCFSIMQHQSLATRLSDDLPHPATFATEPIAAVYDPDDEIGDEESDDLDDDELSEEEFGLDDEDLVDDEDFDEKAFEEKGYEDDIEFDDEEDEEFKDETDDDDF